MKKNTLTSILSYAQQAPSGDNEQPWNIKIENSTNTLLSMYIIELKGVFFNFKNRATFIACGCFLKNLEIAAQEYGYNTEMNLDETSSSKIASIKFIKSNIKKNKLFASIMKRKTNRYPYTPSIKIKKNELEKLLKISKKYKINLKHITEERKEKLDKLCFEVEKIKIENYNVLSTILKSISLKKNPQIGLDYKSLGIGIKGKFLPLLINKEWLLNLLKKIGISKKIAKDSSLNLLNTSPDTFLIYSSFEINKKNLILSGMFTEEVWLELTSMDYSIQPFVNFSLMLQKYFEDPESYTKEENKKFKEITSSFSKLLNFDFSKETPLFFFRAGYPLKETVKTYRKDLSEVILK
jgi:hypothetical protein